jgi:hypothetical protein
MLLFPFSTALVFSSLYSLPISVAWPRTLSEVAELGQELQKYSQSGAVPLAHVIGVLSVTATWKHAWSIPGSVIWVNPYCHQPTSATERFGVECVGRCFVPPVIGYPTSVRFDNHRIGLCYSFVHAPSTSSEPSLPACTGHDAKCPGR